MHMTSPDIRIRREAYFAVGNLLNTVSCQDCVLIIDEFPGVLKELINGLQIFKNDERPLQHVLTTIKILLQDYPPMHSPLKIYQFLD